MVGKTIVHYRILETLGKGGMGIVYKAEDLKLGRTVALKFLSDYSLSDEEDRARFEREARAAAALNHPNICTIYEFHQTDEYAFIVMEYIEGETLKQILKRDGPFLQEKATEIIIAVAEALAEAHKKGVIHRDIKSDNIMITKDGMVKVMDFGLAKLKDAPTITKSKSPMGTVGYMSPELIQEKSFDHRTDLWSLGVVFFEMLTGELPFRGDSDVATMYSILDNKLPNLRNFRMNRIPKLIIKKLIEKDITFRYSSAENLLKDINKGKFSFQVKTYLTNNLKFIRSKIYLILIFILLSFISYTFYELYFNKPSLLKNKEHLVPITDDKGSSIGSISPNSRFLAYKDRNAFLRVKDLDSKESNVIASDENSTYFFPSWSSDGQYLAYISNQLNAISVIDKNGRQVKQVVKKHPGWIFHFSWSPDNEWIAFNWFKNLQTENVNYLNIIRRDGSDEKVVHKLIGTFGTMQSSWFPDSKKLAFYDFLDGGAKKVIRIFDLEKQKISKPIFELKHCSLIYTEGGLAVSPDGEYIVFPDKCGDYIEMIGVRWKPTILAAMKKVVRLTNFSGNGVPSFPYFDRDGNLMSFLLRNIHTDIYTASVNLKEMKFGNDLIPISLPRGSVRDACWNSDGTAISYISDIDGQIDIYAWNKSSDKITRITHDEKWERLLHYVPKKNELSYVVQDTIWKHDLVLNLKKNIFPFKKDMAKRQIIDFTWGSDSTKLFCIAANLEESPVYGKLLKIDMVKQKIDILEPKIYNPGSPLISCSPSGNFLAVSTLDTNYTTQVKIEVFDLLRNKRKKLINYSSELSPGELSWTKDEKHIIYGTYTGESFYQINMVSVENSENYTLVSRPRMRAWHQGKLSPNGDEIILYLRTHEENLWLMGKN